MMRKVDLRMNELEKYQVIKKLVKTNGNKKRAGTRLNCSTRTINRLILKYKKFGKQGFVHGNRGNLPPHTFDPETEVMIIYLDIAKYTDANLAHFAEIVEEELKIKVSNNTINNWLKHKYVLSPKARGKTTKPMRVALVAKLDKTTSTKDTNKLKESITVIESNKAHSRRPRSKYFGEMYKCQHNSVQV